jgi:acetyltransferase-like isoleucine patch superfamily enzyme
MKSNEHQTVVTKQADRRTQLRHGGSLLIEKLLRWCIAPRLRARVLRLFGATIGNNVRIYEIQLFNLESGFTNLWLGDNVHIGAGCRLDLAGPLHIDQRSTLSPGVTILTHSDPGSSHGSKLAARYPPLTVGVTIGSDCWLGANATILAGVTINDLTVVAAGSVVTTSAPPGSLVAGVPAKVKRSINTQH